MCTKRIKAKVPAARLCMSQVVCILDWLFPGLHCPQYLITCASVQIQKRKAWEASSCVMPDRGRPMGVVPNKESWESSLWNGYLRTELAFTREHQYSLLSVHLGLTNTKVVIGAALILCLGLNTQYLLGLSLALIQNDAWKSDWEWGHENFKKLIELQNLPQCMHSWKQNFCGSCDSRVNELIYNLRIK